MIKSMFSKIADTCIINKKIHSVILTYINLLYIFNHYLFHIHNDLLYYISNILKCSTDTKSVTKNEDL